MLRIMNHDIARLIEPYTRRPQPEHVLDDIRSFSLTNNALLCAYTTESRIEAHWNPKIIYMWMAHDIHSFCTLFHVFQTHQNKFDMSPRGYLTNAVCSYEFMYVGTQHKLSYDWAIRTSRLLLASLTVRERNHFISFLEMRVTSGIAHGLHPDAY